MKLLDVGKFIESFSHALLLRIFEALLINLLVRSSLNHLESSFGLNSEILIIILRIPQSTQL